MRPVTRVGLISDTHGLLRPAAFAALEGSELIIHAGDVGDAAILERLSEIAPVRAVRGNTDHGPWAARLPMTDVVEVEDVQLYVLHILADLDLDAEAAGFAAVIHGHSHKPLQEMRGGVLLLNPGSAGPRRFQLPVTLMRLVVEGTKLAAELVDLREVR
jgi:putative phosphoesterase